MAPFGCSAQHIDGIGQMAGAGHSDPCNNQAFTPMVQVLNDGTVTVRQAVEASIPLLRRGRRQHDLRNDTTSTT